MEFAQLPYKIYTEARVICDKGIDGKNARISRNEMRLGDLVLRPLDHHLNEYIFVTVITYVHCHPP